MTEQELRNKIVSTAESYLNVYMGTSKHHEIVDIYNSFKPLARGYALKYTDNWCDGFVSAVFIKCGLQDLSGTEVGVGKHINIFKSKGIWVENDAYRPTGGDIIVYDWNDSGVGDNTTGASHIGIVKSCTGNQITVIEGNMSSESHVGTRTIAVDGRYIRGFAVPKYKEMAGGKNLSAKKIFISPSDQTKNTYSYGNTTEAIQCGKIGASLETALKRCGFETKLMQYYTMAERVKAADEWGADLYMPVHTNACNGKVSGTRMFSYDTSGSGYKACKEVFKYLAPITIGESENIKANPSLYEVKNPSAPTVYTEVDFHDVPEVARWIIEHTDDIAEAMCHGVCDYFGVKYIEPKVTPVKPPVEDEKTTVSVRVLKKGMSGTDVRNVMIILRDMGYYKATIPANDNEFGNNMLTAVKSFQKDNGIQQTGNVDCETYNKLFK